MCPQKVRPSGVTREGAWPASLIDKGECRQVPGSITVKLYVNKSKSLVFRRKLGGFLRDVISCKESNSQVSSNG